LTAHRSIGVIGTGAMGFGVVQSLLRNGFPVLVRDINPTAEAAAVAAGAKARPSPAAVARDSSLVIVLVVDAAQIESVLFGADGAAAALAPDAIVMVSSTVAPAFVASVGQRLATTGARLLDAPVSGGPQRAADGTMTIMVSGDTATIDECRAPLAAISGKCFVVGTRPGAAATFKVLNNQLAAVNLAAGAEAMALALHAGIDPRLFLEVVNASSGASWIFTDRMTRALDGDTTPRAATTLLNKDVGIAVDTAATLEFDAPLARAARDVFAAAVAAGLGPEDDAAMLRYYQEYAQGAPR
jgi:3-hydroxyisobutyrate dehydrogenase-like beta-hydroxyacid dehydrogenase